MSQSVEIDWQVENNPPLNQPEGYWLQAGKTELGSVAGIMLIQVLVACGFYKNTPILTALTRVASCQARSVLLRHTQLPAPLDWHIQMAVQHPVWHTLVKRQRRYKRSVGSVIGLESDGVPCRKPALSRLAHKWNRRFLNKVDAISKQGIFSCLTGGLAMRVRLAKSEHLVHGNVTVSAAGMYPPLIVLAQASRLQE